MRKAHRVRVRKYNRHPGLRGGRMWWADCSCGEFQGYYDKCQAQAWADSHVTQSNQ